MVTSTAVVVALAIVSVALAVAVWRARRSAQLMRSVLSHAELQRNAAIRHATIARRNERALIAADVHDDSIQVVTSAMLRLRRIVDGVDDQLDRAALGAVCDDLRDAMGRLRRLVFDLDLEVDDDLPLATACTALAGEIADDLAIRIDVHCDALLDEPAASSRSLLLRNVRESLTNAVRHGEPTHVIVRLRSVDGGTEVSITDNGRGFDVRGAVPAGHLGLRSMRRRVERAGGRFAVESAAGQGTTVMSWLSVAIDLRAVHEPGADGGGDRFEPGVGTELHEDVLDVVADSVHAEEQPVGDHLT
jgi:signal transduction histidine kinase